MHRFFTNPANIRDGHIRLTGDDVAHIARVLRLQAGDEIVVCDGQSNDYRCAILQADKQAVELKILECSRTNTECPVDITLYQGLPKGDKMDTIVQKCVELGVKCIVPVAAKRSVAKMKDGDKKQARWQRIALEAAKQCGRGIIPVVCGVCSFAEAMAGGQGLKLMPYECEKEHRIRAVLQENRGVRQINIYIGPEGGFDPAEVALAAEAGAHVVSMGPRILRTETAPIAAVTAVLYELGDW